MIWSFGLGIIIVGGLWVRGRGGGGGVGVVVPDR